MTFEGALCAQSDPDLWFPDKGRPAYKATVVCHGCPLLEICLEWALTHEEGKYGVWGGTTETQRQQMRKARGLRYPTHGEKIRAKIAARAARGWTARMIADDLGMDFSWVYRITQELAA